MMASKQPHLHLKDVDLAVNSIIAVLTATLANGERIEIRGFGGFSTIPRAARIARNPKTGEAVSIPNRHLLHFCIFRTKAATKSSRKLPPIPFQSCHRFR